MHESKQGKWEKFSFPRKTRSSFYFWEVLENDVFYQILKILKSRSIKFNLSKVNIEQTKFSKTHITYHKPSKDVHEGEFIKQDKDIRWNCSRKGDYKAFSERNEITLIFIALMVIVMENGS